MLLINEIAQSLSISLADALLSVASTEEKQVYLQWQKIWHLALKLTTSLLDRASHHFVPSALNFTGVHQERIAQVLARGREIVNVHFLPSSLSLFRLWTYST